MPAVALLLVFLLFALPGCATDAPASGTEAAQMQMPQRDADLYPWAEKQAGVVVAVDEIVEPARLEQYFGANLLEQGIVPIAVVVSNRSTGPVAIGPADVLLVQGRRVIDPLPLARVAEAIAAASGNRGGADLRRRLSGVSLQQATLAPNESHQGVLFFPYRPAEKPRDEDTLRSILRLFEGGLRMKVGVTQADTGARLHFGPFRLALGDEDEWRAMLDPERLRELGRSMEREGAPETEPPADDQGSY